MFARIFNSEKYGQLLVVLTWDSDRDDEPRIVVSAKPKDLGICSNSLIFKDDDKAQATFDGMTLQLAEQAAKPIFDFA